jgi:hypothetical protein
MCTNSIGRSTHHARKCRLDWCSLDVCPRCGRRCFKLYRPNPSSGFACRDYHQLTYRSTQEHDARLGPFLKMSGDELESIIENGNDRERRLAMRAQEVKSGASRKGCARRERRGDPIDLDDLWGSGIRSFGEIMIRKSPAYKLLAPQKHVHRGQEFASGIRFKKCNSLHPLQVRLALHQPTLLGL